MTAIRLLAELHHAGIRFTLNGDRIRLEPTRGPIPQPMVQRITDHKPEAVALLSSAEGDTLRRLFDLAIDEGLPARHVGGIAVALPQPFDGCFLVAEGHQESKRELFSVERLRCQGR
jgi:hypothetical protein